jgi:hypothetical protein
VDLGRELEELLLGEKSAAKAKGASAVEDEVFAAGTGEGVSREGGGGETEVRGGLVRGEAPKSKGFSLSDKVGNVSGSPPD